MFGRFIRQWMIVWRSKVYFYMMMHILLFAGCVSLLKKVAYMEMIRYLLIGILGVGISAFINILISYTAKKIYVSMEDEESCGQKFDWYHLKQKVCVCAINGGSYILLYLARGSDVQDLSTLLYCLCTTVLLALSIIDWHTYEIPVIFNYSIAILGIMQLLYDKNWSSHIIGLFAVSGFLFLTDAIATPIMAKRMADVKEFGQAIGGGDIKLMAASGLLLGWELNFIALGTGCILGSIIHLGVMLMKKGDHRFALGPYLALGIFITMICGEQLVSWYLSMMGLSAL